MSPTGSSAPRSSPEAAPNTTMRPNGRRHARPRLYASVPPTISKTTSTPPSRRAAWATSSRELTITWSTPSARRASAFSGRVVAPTTVAPRSFASCEGEALAAELGRGLVG